VGMRKPEQALWDRLCKVMGTRWRADRVENKLLQGMPDVYFGVSPQLHGWIELKALFEGMAAPEFRMAAIAVDLQKASDLDIIDALLRAR